LPALDPFADSGGIPMRNLLAFLAAAALFFAGLGWFLDWYKIQSTPVSAGRRSIQIDLNSKKISEDVHRGVQEGEEKLQNALDKQKSESADMPHDTKQTGPTSSVTPTLPKVIIGFEEEARQVGVVTAPPGVGGL
jgi:hypothetical protein